MKTSIKQLLRRALVAADANSVMSQADRQQTLEDIREAMDAQPKWWVVALKVIAYAIGLILAGYGTTAATLTILPALL